MTTYYKLTDAGDSTRGQTQWGPGVTHQARGRGGLCSDGVIHAYTDPLLAVLMDPVHADYGKTAHLWEAESNDPNPLTDGTKTGVKSLTTVRRLPLPNVSENTRVRFAVYAARTLPQSPAWTAWADRWCGGSDRSNIAARAAARAARDAANAAHAARAADAAAAAANAASDATAASANAADAYNAAHATAAAAVAVVTARDKARGVGIGAPIDLAALAHQAAADEAPSPEGERP